MVIEAAFSYCHTRIPMLHWMMVKMEMMVLGRGVDQVGHGSCPGSLMLLHGLGL
jgi:hypothetical protein